jgi:hypothetical protein
MRLGRCALLGAAGRARTSHVVQFRPVWVECPEEELAEKALESMQRVSALAALRGGGKAF